MSQKLSKLGKPRPGLVRVFRGQTEDYGGMLPTELRPRTRKRDSVWHYCAMHLVAELLTSLGSKADWDQEAVWIEAIAQHYVIRELLFRTITYGLPDWPADRTKI